MRLYNYLRRAYRTLLPLVYARSKFKLFLTTSIDELDSRAQSRIHRLEKIGISPVHPGAGS
jgi:hypothetical protein